MNMRPRLPSAAVHIADGEMLPSKALATFWALWVVFWLLMISVSIGNELHNPLTRWWEPILWEGSSALISTGWMVLGVAVRRRYACYLDRPLRWFGRYLRWLPLVFVTWIAVVYAIRLGVYAAVGRTYEHPGWGFIVVYERVGRDSPTNRQFAA